MIVSVNTLVPPISVEIQAVESQRCDCESPRKRFYKCYAAAVSSKAHELAMAASKDGIHEFQIQSIIEGFFVYGGTSGWAYPSIVGCSENAFFTIRSTIRLVIQTKLFLLMPMQNTKDMPLTLRSWPIGGTFSEAQKEIYEIVLDAQEKAIDACRVGNPYNEPHDVARKALAEGSVRLGVIKQSVEEALDMDTGELKKWYMHNTGHWLGLDVHDVGTYKPDGTPRLLKPGMVLTVEPGLYFGAWRPDVDCPQHMLTSVSESKMTFSSPMEILMSLRVHVLKQLMRLNELLVVFEVASWHGVRFLNASSPQKESEALVEDCIELYDNAPSILDGGSTLPKNSTPDQ